MAAEINIALIGGDGRKSWEEAGVVLHRFPSARFQGNGAFRRALEAIQTGRVTVVVALARWLGHTETRSLKDACHKASIPLHLVPGGLSAARRTVQALAA